MGNFMKHFIGESKYFLLSGLLAFILTQVASPPYDWLVAGFWLGFWGGVVFKGRYKYLKF